MIEHSLVLQLLDQAWKDHLLQLDHLRHGINLRAYGQRDPLNEYKREAFEMFQSMLAHLRERVTQSLSLVELQVTNESGEDMSHTLRARSDRARSKAIPAMAGSGSVEVRCRRCVILRPAILGIRPPGDGCRGMSRAPVDHRRSISTATGVCSWGVGYKETDPPL